MRLIASDVTNLLPRDRNECVKGKLDTSTPNLSEEKRPRPTVELITLHKLKNICCNEILIIRGFSHRNDGVGPGGRGQHPGGALAGHGESHQHPAGAVKAGMHGYAYKSGSIQLKSY